MGETVYVGGSLVDVRYWNDVQIRVYADELEEAADQLREFLKKRREIKREPAPEEK